MGFRENFLRGAGRVFGSIGHVAKRVGQIGLATGKFIAANHQPLAMLAHGLGEATGHPVMKNIGTAAMIGSGMLAASGVGHNYVGG